MREHCDCDAIEHARTSTRDESFSRPEWPPTHALHSDGYLTVDWDAVDELDTASAVAWPVRIDPFGRCARNATAR